MSRENESFTITGAWLESRLIESMHAHTAATLEDWSGKLRMKAGELWANGRPDGAAVAEYLRDTLCPQMVAAAKEARKKQASAKLETEALPAPVDAPTLEENG